MPPVDVTSLAGWSPEKKVALIAGVMDSIVVAIDAPIDSVRVVIGEVRP